MTDDIVEIQQRMYQYCHAVDRGTVDDVMDVFHASAVLIPSHESDEKFPGKAQVRGWYEQYFKTVRATTDVLRHTVSTPHIQLDGDAASSVLYLTADAIQKDGRSFMVTGRYEDRWIRDQGRWWIAERAIIVNGNYPLAGA